MAVSYRSDGLELASVEKVQSKSGTVRRKFNPDPTVADFDSAEDCFEWFISAFHD